MSLSKKTIFVKIGCIMEEHSFVTILAATYPNQDGDGNPERSIATNFETTEKI